MQKTASLNDSSKLYGLSVATCRCCNVDVELKNDLSASVEPKRILQFERSKHKLLDSGLFDCYLTSLLSCVICFTFVMHFMSTVGQIPPLSSSLTQQGGRLMQNAALAEHTLFML